MEAGHPVLYLVPHLNDINTRCKLGQQPPWENCDLLDNVPEATVLVFCKTAEELTPTKVPICDDDDSMSSGSSRGVQQSDFRANVMRLSGWKDFLLGKSIQQGPGQAGESGEAGHIVPVSKHRNRFGAKKEDRWDVLEQQGFYRNLYITPNGIAFLLDHHSFFDELDLSIDVDKNNEIVVWLADAPAEIKALHGKRAVGVPKDDITSPKLLRWHHQQCSKKHDKV